MKKILIGLILIITVNLSAQNQEREQSIELPDFVITGVQSVDVPTLTKKKAELHPLLEKQFFNPQYQPEELNLGRINVPFHEAPKILQEYSPRNSFVRVAAGQYTLPLVDIFISHNFSNSILSLGLFGNNSSDYIKNADKSKYGINLKSDFFTSQSSSFLPGITFALEAGYSKESYKLFGSVLPTPKRINQLADFSFATVYSTSKVFNFSLNTDFSYLNQDEVFKTKEFDMNIQGKVKFILPGLDVDVKSKLRKINFDDSVMPEMKNDYFSTKAGISLRAINNFMIGGGVYLSKQDSNSFFSPYANVDIKINKFITASAELSGSSEIYSYSELLGMNQFIKAAAKPIYVEKAIDIDLSIKYEYDKYFQLVGGVNYVKYNDYFYFSDATTTGIYDVVPIRKVAQIRIYGNSYFHLGPYGSLYGNVEFQQFTMNDDNRLPYEPLVSSSIEYKYVTGIKVGFGAKYRTMIDFFADVSNNSKVSSYHHLSLNAFYEIFQDAEIILELENILNKDNYLWKNYLEKPFEIIIGFKYKW